jgi:hypothetical protein
VSATSGLLASARRASARPMTRAEDGRFRNQSQSGAAGDTDAGLRPGRRPGVPRQAAGALLVGVPRRPPGKRCELPRRRPLGCARDSGACLLKASASSVPQASSDVSAAAERKSQPRCRTALVRLVPSMNAVVVDAARRTRLGTASDQSTRVPETCPMASSETVASTPARPLAPSRTVDAATIGEVGRHHSMP